MTSKYNHFYIFLLCITCKKAFLCPTGYQGDLLFPNHAIRRSPQAAANCQQFLLCDLQTNSQNTQKAPGQAHRLVRQNCAVSSSTDISDSRKDCAKPKYAQKESSHRKHEQSAGDSKALISTRSIRCSKRDFFLKACRSIRSPTAARRTPANTWTQ